MIAGPSTGVLGGARPKSRGQPKGQAKPTNQPMLEMKFGGPDCSLCSGVCCGVARALVEEAFGLDSINLSPKVSRGSGFWGGTYFSFIIRPLTKR